jgi:hypothetical protein
MKKISTIISILLITYSAKSQDIIIKKNGDDLKVKVIEITKEEIKYKNFENIDGPVYYISKNDVFMIRYQNGTKETFIETTSVVSKPIVNIQFVPIGTMIKFKSNDKMSGRKAKEGNELNFELNEQLIIGNTLVANKGNLVKGRFTKVEHSESLGKKGEIEFEVLYLLANDGTKINLTSENKISGSRNVTGRVIGAVFLSPLFLLSSGTEAKIKKDQVFIAYVAKY